MDTVRHTTCGTAILWYTSRADADDVAKLDPALEVRTDIAASGCGFWIEPKPRPFNYVHPYDQSRVDELAGRSEADAVRSHLANCTR